jgi:2-methylisocitrate lyase-like PEP mutase family enzyme
MEDAMSDLTDKPAIDTQALAERCERLRALHVPGDPLLLPNAWDAATARAVVAAGFPIVATTSAGVAAALGHQDHHGAPAEEMFSAAARIARAVDVPVTVDAEAGYGMQPAELVGRLQRIGAAGCNLEDTDHEAGGLRAPEEQAEWLHAVRDAAREADYPLVINARIDVFLSPILAGSAEPQEGLLGDALGRAGLYRRAGAECVFPIAIWEADVIRSFVSEFGGSVNVLATPRAPSLPELAELGVARISWGSLLQRAALETFSRSLAELDATERR